MSTKATSLVSFLPSSDNTVFVGLLMIGMSKSFLVNMPTMSWASLICT